MSLRETLKGTGVALVTPLTSKGTVDLDALARLIDTVISNGVEYLVSLGTTGEAPTLTNPEKLDIIQATYETVKGRVPIVIGIGGNDTRDQIADLESFPLDEATAILSVTPYYNKPSQEGFYQHYKALASASPKPLILYNIPGRSGRNMSAHTTLRLAELDNIEGIKEASGDIGQCMVILRDRPSGFLVVSGDDALALPQIACGMDGVISVAANCFTARFTDMIRLCLKGDFAAAKKINDTLIDGYELLFVENNPAGVKAFLAESGLIDNYLRLPLTPLSKEWHAKVKEYYETYASQDLQVVR